MWIFNGPMGSPFGAAAPESGGARAGTKKDDTIVMISTFTVPAALEDAFLGWWRMARPFLAAQPGFVSARLHKSLDAREGSKYVNILEWRGAAAYRDSLTKIWTSGPPPIPGIDWRPQLYEIVEEI